MDRAAFTNVLVPVCVRRIVGRIAALFLVVLTLGASEYRGQVKFGGLPVPGATVTATQTAKAVSAISDAQGNYRFPDLADGVWTIQIEMPGFALIKEDVTIASSMSPAEWNLKMLALDQMNAGAPQRAPAPPSQLAAPSPASAEAQPKHRKAKTPPAPTNTQTSFQRADVNSANPNASNSAQPNAPGGDASSSSGLANQSSAELSERAADGLLINGTANNGASSPFAQSQAFGNNRRGTKSQYNGNIGIIFDTSYFDARNFSITGQDTPKLDYDHLQGVFAFGGPVQIPHLIRNGSGGQFFINYQWTRNRNATLATGLVPTAAEREGIIPSVGTVPIAFQAQQLLNFYPLPNFSGTRYNFQTELGGNTHTDSLQTRYNKTIGRKNFLAVQFALQSNRSDNPNLFGFLDTSRYFAINSNVNFRHSFTPRFFTTFGFSFNRYLGQVVPFFANRLDVSNIAKIEGNNQDPENWGPPTLNFASGITSLTDGFASHFRPQTGSVSIDNLWSRSRHNISFGGDFRRQQFNLLTQQDPRGTFTFTGLATGSDLGDFFAGIPDTSSIAFGNADKYLRASTSEAYISDDWRVTPGFTLNAGVRWEYWSPITEKYGRLVNLDIAPGFTSEVPVCSAPAQGCLSASAAGFPSSLMRPDKRAAQPRVALSWRPLAASSLVVRAGYGVYYNTSVYYTLATMLAQQPPLSTSLTVANSPDDPLTLQHGFGVSPTITPNTVAVDPNFRPGYSQNWQASIQRDLPAALVLTVMYLGSKGTHQVQDFLPNTYPVGAPTPCATCPSGFQYITSNGNSTREAGQVQLRRRLQAGFTATLQYTYAKAIDDAALGGKNQGTPVIAQNWLDLSAERGLSSFDQRHLLNLSLQYTTGMGLHGGTLVNGWRGALFKQWTAATQINAGTGLPLTPTYIAAVPGTGVSGGVLRPEYTGAPLYAAPPGLALNPAAYVAPSSGQYGNAGRDSITGPAQFSLNASLGRIFQVSDRFNLDFRVDSTNALNHVTFPNWVTTVNSTQFGLPTAANAMRSIQTTIRLRF